MTKGSLPVLAEGAVGGSRSDKRKFEASCEERARNAEDDGVGAMRGRECVLCREPGAVGLFMGVEARSRT